MATKADDLVAEPLRHSMLLLSTGIRMHVVQLSPSPGVSVRGTVLCVHGFPDTWFGWRHQIRIMASHGWHVVVPDQRGYGETDAPRKPEQYQMKLLCGDMCALMDALGLEQVVLLGHDWGGMLVWNMALQHRERVAAVGSVCTAFYANNPDKNPWPGMKANPGRFDYQMWFQQAEAEQEFDRDPYYTMKVQIRGTSREDRRAFMEHADAETLAMPPTQKDGILKGMAPNEKCPRTTILSEEELLYYAAQFAHSGFFGPVSWYRNVERNWKWMRATAGQKVTQPAFMVTAGRDPVLKASMVESLQMRKWIPLLIHKHVEEAGHWVLQEKPEIINAHICAWLDALPPTLMGSSRGARYTYGSKLQASRL